MSRKREGSSNTSASRKPRYEDVIMIADSSDDEQSQVPPAGDDECMIIEDKCIPPDRRSVSVESREVPGSSKETAPKQLLHNWACPICDQKFGMDLVSLEIHAALCNGKPIVPHSPNLNHEKPSTSQNLGLPQPVLQINIWPKPKPPSLIPNRTRTVGDDLLPCPLCGKKFHLEILQVHAAECTGAPEEEVPPSTSKQGTPKPLEKVACPLCGEEYDLVTLQVHAAECSGAPEPPHSSNVNHKKPSTSKALEKVACPLCSEQFELEILQIHAAECNGEPAKTGEAPSHSSYSNPGPSTSQHPDISKPPAKPVKKPVKKNASETRKIRNEKISEITQPVSDDVPLSDLGTVHCLDAPSPTHAFYDSKTRHPKTFLKIYNAELKRLRTSMPKGIHLWHYESRLDLLSFAIEGPPGTPYEFCIFTFDVLLPAGYPLTKAPKVHYRSTIGDGRDGMAHRINPNLYSNGKVCLSLLGTWSGSGCEKWSYTSNILQLVVSLQGLTLNAEPYFNEPGFEAHRNTPDGVVRSRNYNENLTTLLCDHVVTTIRNPGAPFEELVRESYFGSKESNKEGMLGKFIQKMENLIANRPDNLPYPLRPFTNSKKPFLTGKLQPLKKIKAEHDRKNSIFFCLNYFHRS
ncbi:Oidioi.mRNA.OKI2018_I69.XSR.g16529.t1.cds [Oikopleura dioica]|uniref:Oidioi.mRNA.OKI2018_I69.XSR.g16529.t1.cds n=1 Tax=Oikopleura dioica TaxID=34765 RepID=A0ABN7SKB7_OIKDI|nr:Oidioi.mRNA.OKI2018_I69.XSR.g16529.t1.cds [Oikopleura dioica]